MSFQDSERQPMTREELRELVQQTVRETLVEIGVDNRQPIELQQDMAFLRDFRKAKESVVAKTLVATVGILVTAALGALVLGIRQLLRSSP